MPGPHPVSQAQKRWAFSAEKRGELPKGKAKEWAERVKGKDLPETSKKNNPLEFIMSLVEWAGTEASIETAVETIFSEFPEVVDPAELVAWLQKQKPEGEAAPEGEGEGETKVEGKAA